MNKTIIVADDSIVTQILLKHILEEAGYTVLRFNDGQSILDFLKKESADLLISDICMPGLDGLALVNVLRGVGAYQKLPVVLITGTFEQLAAAEAANVHAVMTKPISTWQIQESVAKILKVENA